MSTYRGQNLGLRLVKALTDFAWHTKCYKVFLDCDEKNVGFYQKCGYERKGAQMAQYAPNIVPK